MLRSLRFGILKVSLWHRFLSLIVWCQLHYLILLSRLLRLIHSIKDIFFTTITLDSSNLLMKMFFLFWIGILKKVSQNCLICLFVLVKDLVIGKTSTGPFIVKFVWNFLVADSVVKFLFIDHFGSFLVVVSANQFRILLSQYEYFFLKWVFKIFKTLRDVFLKSSLFISLSVRVVFLAKTVIFLFILTSLWLILLLSLKRIKILNYELRNQLHNYEFKFSLLLNVRLEGFVIVLSRKYRCFYSVKSLFWPNSLLDVWICFASPF